MGFDLKGLGLDDSVKAKIMESHESTVGTLTDGFQTELATATDGLKRSRDTILDEKKKLEARYKGIDPDSIGEAVAFHNEYKDNEFLKTGKIDELVDQRTSQLKADHDDALLEVTTELETSRKTGKGYQSLYETKILEDTIKSAALNAKVIPSALEDVVARAKNVFSLGDDFKVEARDSEGNLLKNEKDIIVTPANWMEVLKATSPHFWPASKGAGFGGSGGGGGSDSVEAMNHLANTDHAAFVAARRKQTAR